MSSSTSQPANATQCARRAVDSLACTLRWCLLAAFHLAGVLAQTSTEGEPQSRSAGVYYPVPGGWGIRLESPHSPNSETGFGVAQGNARLHRRPLFPPADKTMIWTADELPRLERCGFRPLVLAYNEPRFLFDFHSAGGLLGHLYLGLETAHASKWLHQFSSVEVRYQEGAMCYSVRDPAFPGVQVTLIAAPMADSAGLILQLELRGLSEPASLVWAYGGASAFFTNYAMDAPQFGFAPDQCRKDHVSWEDGRFRLRRAFDKTDVYLGEVFAAARYLSQWEAVIQGGSSWKGNRGFGAPPDLTNSPTALARGAEWSGSPADKERADCVAVQQIPLTDRTARGYVVVGMGGNIAAAVRSPEVAWGRALARNRAISNRIVTHTPDAYLDSAVSMMAFATEGTWGDLAILHGGWSWRFAYLGWRGWYGSACYGWTDRVRQSIRNHTRLGRVAEGPDAGGLGSLLEYAPGIYYNMNEVFIDQVRQYFDYTGDLPLMREIYPVLTGILEWEDRRLRPGKLPLYENSLNTWISDSHWYIQGQCTQASAYMLRAYEFIARLADRLGQDSSRFARQARDIRSALNEHLWQSRAGVFAEYRDTRGLGLLHPEPELATLYHAAEFGAADPGQIYQMLRWADTHLRHEATPGRGKLVWSSNWSPNRGRSFTHSTYEMAYGEELNLALTDYLVGRRDVAYAILRATLAGIFNGPTPGGLSCHAYTDGRQRANDEFTDAISMWGRTVSEGLFGILPRRSDGVVELRPQFPSDWRRAEIRAPHLSYRWKRSRDAVRVDWTSPVRTRVWLTVPVEVTRIQSGRADGVLVPVHAEPGFDGSTWIGLVSEPRLRGSFTLRFKPRTASPGETEIALTQGSSLGYGSNNTPVAAWRDPQGLLSDAELENGTFRASVTGSPGPGLIFLLTGEPPCTTWNALPLRILPSTDVRTTKRWTRPESTDRDLARWAAIDLGGIFNAELTNVLQRVTQAARPPLLPASQVGFGYWRDHLLQYHGSRNQEVSDAAWRRKVGPDQIAWTTDGIPFKTRREGPNIAVVTRAGGFPTQLDVPVGTKGRRLYLMLSGMTFPAQSHVVNVRVTLRYADATQETFDLESPSGMGDCWSTWCGRFHDQAANGFENLGGRTGPAGSAEVADLTQPVPVDTEAHLLAFDLRADVELSTVGLEAIANDVIFGLMGAAVWR